MIFSTKQRLQCVTSWQTTCAGFFNKYAPTLSAQCQQWYTSFSQAFDDAEDTENYVALVGNSANYLIYDGQVVQAYLSMMVPVINNICLQMVNATTLGCTAAAFNTNLELASCMAPKITSSPTVQNNVTAPAPKPNAGSELDSGYLQLIVPLLAGLYLVHSVLNREPASAEPNLKLR